MGCKNGGKCVNLVGDFRCDCDPEYSGRFCESSYNDCLDDEFKCGHGLCVDGHRGQVGTPMFSCICEDGWATSNDDQTCNNDVNECQEKPCSKNPEVQCFNNPGSYTCGGCPTGYIGNGWACSDIDECSSNNGGCSQAPLVVCINTAGSNTCGPCPSGYTGDGRVCDVMNACEVNNGGCDVIATCTVNPAVGNIVTCTCPDGFLGNGVGVGGCVQGDTCADVCVNGQCQENQDKVEFCVCNIGWSGVNCDVNIDDCLTQPCNNGGTCIDGVGEYYCKCPNNYGGTNCEIDESGCGAYYVQDSGSFSFPAMIGQTYPSSSNCAWVVQVAAGKVIEATFPIFELEPHPDCVYDFLQIHDGSSASAHQIGKYCDTTVPGDPLTSTHNLLYFWFVSNAQNNYKGFQVVWQTGDPVCGESITHETYGDIKSPGYPGNYPPNRDCYWTIEVAAGFVVQLMFGTLALETHDNCTFDFLEIRNGLLETNLILARYCSSLSPPPLLSTAPGVWIYFHTDPYVSDAGFHITWSQQPVGISGCGGYHDDEDGVIISPNYPNLYLRNQECYYQIHIGVGGKILFIITNMDIEDHEECSWDYLELRDGSDENSLLVGRFCGQTTPPPFTSTTNDLWMKFRSDEAQGGSGFRATYTVACGGMYTAPNGQLQSPYYPLTYPANKDCFYEIRQEPGNFIMLMFDDVEIEEEADCNYDYIEVRDGSTTDAPLLSKICGTTIPAPIMSSHNYMWIHFASDAHTGGGGFHATYTTEYTGCGGLYTTPSGSIQSPDHPTPYPHGANCSYYISVHPTLLVNLRFLSFALEQPNDDGVCGDFVEVFDDQVSLGRYCGTTSPPDILSTSYKVTIFFSAGQTINNDGFAAAYSTVNATTACGGLVTANQGYITSPNYPSNYDDMRDCVWVVTVQTSLQIRVNFSDFSLESPNSEGVCDADYLEIRNGGYDDSALIGTYCGTSISSYFVTHGNQMFVKFSTNQKNNFRGFLMDYNAAVTGCGGTLTTSVGYFQSPNFPFAYDHNSACSWLINVAQGSGVRLIFTAFEVLPHGVCDDDYVEIFDGPSYAYPSLGRNCGASLPPPTESRTNQLYVQFQSDQSQSGSGFVAQYDTICKRTITTSETTFIQSMDYPDSYPPNRDCEWLVQGTLGSKMNVTFRYLDLEGCEECSCDYIELFDGSDAATSPKMGRYCSSAPNQIRTSSNHLIVTFRTNAQTQSSGFNIQVDVDGCSSTLTEPSGSFTSPNFPNNYDDNKECIWSIMTSYGSSVQLTIDVFDVEHHTQCDYDVLEIYNGLDTDPDYKLATLCNMGDSPPSLPLIVSSSSNFMTVRFLTDAYVNGRGFSASYEEIVGECGGLVTTSNGAITSPNYPNNYGSNKDCQWFIDIGEGSTIIITFDTFDLEFTNSCGKDFVSIYDGNSTSAKLLLFACGSNIPDPIVSTGHSVLMQFHANSDGAYNGFKARYEANCGGRLLADKEGIITSPNYPLNYIPDHNCTWIVTSPLQDGHVTLVFTHMDIYINPYGDGTCGVDDYVAIYEGEQLGSTMQGMYCGREIPPPITSYGNTFMLTMVSRSYFQLSGFRLIYTPSSSYCGGELTAQSGYFNSPNYPDVYPSSTDCVWTISASPGNRITLSFQSFSLEPSASCNFDFLQIREGSDNGQVLATLCGVETPANLTTINGHVLYIHFHSDITTQGLGFRAQYEHLFGSTTIAEFDGVIASPLYPGFYPSLLDVEYLVYAPVGRVITYVFTFFDLEQPTDIGCEYDYLVIFDGDSIQSTPLFLGCGNDNKPPPGTTTQGALMLLLHSDWGLNGRGFYMTWTAIDSGGIEPNPTNVPTIPTGTCGSEQMVAAVYPIYFVSPGYPFVYPNNLNCVWTIEAAAGYRIAFTFVSIDIENIDSCNFDFVKIYEGPTVGSTLQGRYCGKQPPSTIYSMDNYLTIQMVTDGSVGYPGFNASYQQACGGFIRGDVGAITSPNYPNNYPPNTFCEWTIVATIGTNISINFDQTFDIRNNDDQLCNNGDYIQLLNGRHGDSPPLVPNHGDGNGKYCGNTAPLDLATLGNGLFVRFSSNSKTAGGGFRLTYSSQEGACGAVLTLTDQFTASSFTSPNYPNGYPTAIDCYWIISAPPTESVQLDFTDFNIQSHPQCDKDYVLVINGHTGNEEILGKFCGTEIPPTVKSTGSDMTVRLRSDEATTLGGFDVVYKIAECGGTLIGVGGVIMSPNYPMDYPNSQSCQWVVRGPAYHFINFEFNALQLNNTEGGCDDYVEFTSYNFSGPTIAKVCGDATPGIVESTTNEVFVKFVSDSSFVSSGFSLTFTATEDSCGGDLMGGGGVISTPNYPNAYDHARTCTWNIIVDETRSITLTFNAFNVEDPHTNGYCYWDNVQVFNGINPNSPTIRGRMCGSIIPPPIQSSGNTMRVVFDTDASVNNGGFLATYDSNQERICGGSLNSNEGSFASPNYPANYNNSMECVWLIDNYILVNSTILVTFDAFAMEHHILCEYDYISFKAGSSYNGYPVATFCGQTKPTPFGISFPQVYIQFISDSSFTDVGFTATYKFTGCGGYVGGTTSGVITSPNFPDVYNNNEYCLWTIAVAEGSKINLHWTDFVLEQHNNCNYDYLKLYNGPTTDSPLIDVYCGTNQPTEFQSGGNTITMLFQSDFSVTRGGWRVVWREESSGCGNIIYHGTSGIIASPGYPATYPSNSDCVWQIIVDPAFHVQLIFHDDFYIEPHDDCAFDYVAIFDGTSDFASESYRFCGQYGDTSAPGGDPYASSLQAMTLRFRSDFSQQRRGFGADWNRQCGQTLTSRTGTLQSPNYPAPYTNNLHCEYVITFADDQIFIKLTFNSFNVEYGSNSGVCDFDYVRVYSGPTTDDGLLETFCGNFPPLQPVTSKGSMLVVFHTDETSIDYGFQAKYETSECGGFLNATTGSINAFTNSDVHNKQNCTWQILSSPQDEIIELKFSSFDLETHANCDFDFVKIYDGINTNAPLIGTYCGTHAPTYIMSTSNMMTIEYVTDDLFTGDGFTSSYRSLPGPEQGCGGIMTSQSGVIRSIDLDNSGNYDPNLNCLWKIKVDTNFVVKLEFEYFRLENATVAGCVYDNVEIRDGSTEFDPLAMEVCGINVPQVFISSTNYLFIRFLSDPLIEDIGFSANFTSVPQTCGGIYEATNQSQILTSLPLFGQSNSLNCRWTIDSGIDTNTFIQISFDSFEIISQTNATNRCTNNYLQISDYPLGESNGQSYYYCGSSLPPDFHSFGQIVKINLRTDVSATGVGFTLKYKATGCSKIYTKPMGQLFSPGWPDTYAKNLNCETTIITEEGKDIQLFFNKLSLESTANCSSSDRIQIRAGQTPTSPLVTQVCGSMLPNPVFPNTSSVYIKFETNNFLQGKGYDITYTSAVASCGGNITGDHGSLYSPYYPHAYEPNLDCFYSIRTPPGRPITLHITFIDIYYECGDNGCSCVDDLLYIYLGPDVTSQLYNAYCGYGRLSDIKIQNNAAGVRIKTSDFVANSRNNQGFHVEFES